MQEQRARFQLQAHPEPGGSFEIIAMTSGEGNGWQFSPAVLQGSLPLWDGAACFIDHALGPRSLRDLAGLIAPYTRSIEIIEPWLTLHGLRLVFAKNQ